MLKPLKIETEVFNNQGNRQGYKREVYGGVFTHLYKTFPQFVVIHTVKGFGIVNKAEVDVFSGTLLLF